MASGSYAYISQLQVSANVAAAEDEEARRSRSPSPAPRSSPSSSWLHNRSGRESQYYQPTALTGVVVDVDSPTKKPPLPPKPSTLRTLKPKLKTPPQVPPKPSPRPIKIILPAHPQRPKSPDTDSGLSSCKPSSNSSSNASSIPEEVREAVRRKSSRDLSPSSSTLGVINDHDEKPAAASASPRLSGVSFAASAKNMARKFNQRLKKKSQSMIGKRPVISSPVAIEEMPQSTPPLNRSQSDGQLLSHSGDELSDEDDDDDVQESGPPVVVVKPEQEPDKFRERRELLIGKIH